jgi:hypothetical protein
MADSLEYWGFGDDCERAVVGGGWKWQFVSLRFSSVCAEKKTHLRLISCSKAFGFCNLRTRYNARLPVAKTHILTHNSPRFDSRS